MSLLTREEYARVWGPLPEMPESFYRQKPEKLNINNAVINPDLSYDFLVIRFTRCQMNLACLEHSREKISPELFERLLPTSEELMIEGQIHIYSWNYLVPDSAFEPHFHTFGRKIWIVYLEHRSIGPQHCNYLNLGDLAIFYGLSFPFEELCSRQSSSRFFHKDAPAEFFRQNLDLALKQRGKFQSPAFEQVLEEVYPVRLDIVSHFLSPEFLDRHPELIDGITMVRKDLPMWFTDKYWEKVKFGCPNRLSKATYTKLKAKFPNFASNHTYCSLLEVDKNESEALRILPKNLHQQENFFTCRIKLTLLSFVSC